MSHPNTHVALDDGEDGDDGAGIRCGPGGSWFTSWILDGAPWSGAAESLIMDTSDDAAPWSGAPKAGAADA